jgi:hypothetical protein
MSYVFQSLSYATEAQYLDAVALAWLFGGDLPTVRVAQDVLPLGSAVECLHAWAPEAERESPADAAFRAIALADLTEAMRRTRDRCA